MVYSARREVKRLEKKLAMDLPLYQSTGVLGKVNKAYLCLLGLSAIYRANPKP